MITVGYFISIGLLVLPAMDYFLGLRILPNYKPSGEKDEVSAVGGDGVSVIIACHNEEKNIDVVKSICDLLDELMPLVSGSYSNQIIHVEDRPGHDRRYAIDATKIKKELTWVPKETFLSGLRKTVIWYLSNQRWCENIKKQDQKVIVK